METKVIVSSCLRTDVFAQKIEELMRQGYTQGQFTANETNLFIIMNPPRLNNNNQVGIAQ